MWLLTSSLLLLVGAAAIGQAADVVCDPGKSSKVVFLKSGQNVGFSTQAGAKYGKEVNCKVTFKRGKKTQCSLSFTCSAFSLTAANSQCTKKSDMFIISKKKYCQSSGPSVEVSSRALKVLFKSHKKSQGGAGASCTASCTPSGATPAPTPGPATPPPSADCLCGLAQRQTRIVGGEQTEVNEYPWQVGLVTKGQTFVFCGATVLSDLWVLTAAHCTDGRTASSTQVLLGEHDYNSLTETTSLRMDLAQIVQHPGYDARTVDYDFSLLKMTSKVSFTNYPNIRPACLPDSGSEDYVDFLATVTGWGSLTSGGSTTNKLREVEVKVLSNTACKSSYGSSSITSRMLCASAASGLGGKDACQGDSGGPLVAKAASSNGVTAGQNYELIGVVSFGIGCAEKDYPGVYSRVTALLPWITSTTSTGWSSCSRT